MKWHLITSRGSHPLLMIDIVHIGMKEYTNKVSGLDFNFKNWKRIGGESFLSEEEYNFLFNKFIDLAKKDNFLFKLTKKYLKCCNDLEKKSKELGKKKFRIMDNNELKKEFNFFVNDLYVWWGYNYFPWIIGDALKKVIETGLLKILKNKTKLNDYLNILTSTSKETEINKEQKELLEIAKNVKNKGFNSQIKKIKEHANTFNWLNSYIFSIKPYTIKDVKKRIKNLLKENIEKKYQEIKNRANNTEDNFKKAIKKLDIDKSLLKIINLAREWIFVKNYRVESINKIHFNTKPLFDEIARRMSIKYEDVIQLKIKEISDFLDKGNLPDLKEVKERKKEYAIIMKNGKFRIFIKDELKRLKEKEKIKVIDIIKGIFASPGFVRGKVRIIKDQYKIGKFKENEILVAPETNPHFVTIMEKAKAIVTDFGGITSHAAIISRELKKPCIIGTKIATKVLKDGDLVEVDANKGIVKKIK